ncbi:DUF1902 domain-containing protein [Jiella pelagia]|uniref:DUF1902 domain-containing protein n=1 Tax=Jiella pelagia TaxID=2986949 RepID=A0ABY7BZZ2_9HYPH|nr:DUF1902 domain-containing protein [Jiella pelagia]WAP69348.1 DUF1902 domain-containing protein [Jiella pelagia]
MPNSNFLRFDPYERDEKEAVMPTDAIRINIRAGWDQHARVWTATSVDLPGLVLEVEDQRDLVAELRDVLPDFLECSGKMAENYDLSNFKVDFVGGPPTAP